jgi:hypothetical protein
MDLKELSLVDPETHWYYQSKLAILKKARDRYFPHAMSLADIGAGSGFFGLGLADFDAGMHVTCVDTAYLADSSQLDGALRFVRSGEGVSADVYLFIDILEHVVDDRALLTSYTAAAAPGSLVLISAPAFMSLRSPHDVFLGHYRRYRLPQLTALVTGAGLEVLHQRYLFGSIFPIVWLIRRLRRGRRPRSDLATLPRPLNRMLIRLLNAEGRLGCNRLAGVSAFVVARVPGRDPA